jgi:hypothetical protein
MSCARSSSCLLKNSWKLYGSKDFNMLDCQLGIFRRLSKVSHPLFIDHDPFIPLSGSRILAFEQRLLDEANGGKEHADFGLLI